MTLNVGGAIGPAAPSGGGGPAIMGGAMPGMVGGIPGIAGGIPGIAPIGPGVIPGMPAIAAIMGLGVVRKNPYFSFRGLAKTIGAGPGAGAAAGGAAGQGVVGCQPPERQVWILPHDAKPHDGGNGGHARDDSWTDGCR